MSTNIKYILGDATNPLAKGNKIIVHICNTLGKWGKGFVMAVSKKWPKTREEYLNWYNSRNNFNLGEVQFTQVSPVTCVGNMIGQQGIGTGSKGPPIRYDAVKKCLQTVAKKALETKASVHMPRIGCGLAGGKWEKIEPIIKETLCDKGIEVYVYDKS